MNTSAFGVEKGTLIRVPATANLLLDSADRNTITDASGMNISTPWDFVLNRSQPLINGYFTRVGTTEVVLEWCVNNISSLLGNNTFGITDTSGNITTITLDDGSYTVQQALEQIASALNTYVPGGSKYTFDVLREAATNYICKFGNTNPSLRQFRINAGKLAYQLSLNYDNVPTAKQRLFVVNCPDLRPYRYLDFVCEQLTAVQDVKDASTNPSVRDVLCRWYFADDVPNQIDGLGFPVLMGYTRFVTRRLFNPPKQIKWEQNQQVGGYLRFTVYSDQNTIVYDGPISDSNWLMTLQLTEG